VSAQNKEIIKNRIPKGIAIMQQKIARFVWYFRRDIRTTEQIDSKWWLW